MWASVLILLHFASPFAVPSLVALIIVNPFEAVVQRPRSHIDEEVLKGSPSFADANTTTSVAFVSYIFGIGASLNHRGPTAVFAASKHAVFRRLLFGKDFFF